MFFVLLPVGLASLLGLASNYVVYLDTPLESATYNWPCENTESGRYIPTFGMVWPCALLIVMAKLNLIGNCFRLNLNGSVMSSDGDIGIRGIKILLPAYCPFTISQSIALLSNPLTTKRVPLHSPLWGSMLRRSITRQFFYFKLMRRKAIWESSSTESWL